MAAEPRPRTFLHEVALATRSLTLGTMGDEVSTCILTTRIGLAVLDHYQITARPQAVRVRALNLEAARLLAQGVPLGQWPQSAWSVGIDGKTPPTVNPGRPGWNGHLVLIVRETPAISLGAPRALLDLTADQFDRPQHRLVIGGPIMFGIGSGQPFTPQDPLGAIVDDEPGDVGAYIEYWPMAPGSPEATAWREAPDWAGDGYTTEFVEQAKAEIITRLG